MIITFSTENILESLRNVCNVAENKQNMPILANVYFKLSAGSIFLSATDLEVEVCSEDTFEGTGEIETTMNARKLYDMVKSLEGKDELSFNFEDNKTTISSGKSKFVLTAMDASATNTTLTFENCKFSVADISKSAEGAVKVDITVVCPGDTTT